MLLDALLHGRLEALELAAKALGVIGDRGAVSGLVEALMDTSMWARIPAAEALRRIGTPEAQKALKSHTHT